jgi:hypothetical protein
MIAWVVILLTLLWYMEFTGSGQPFDIARFFYAG